MAATEGLKIAYEVDDKVQLRVKMSGLSGTVHDLNVAGSAQQVDNAQGIALGDRVRGVDDEALAVVDGASLSLTGHSYNSEYFIYLDNEKVREDIRQSTDDVLQKTRS